MTTEMKNKGGRPKKTTSDLPNNWKGKVLKEMKEGASRQEIKAILGISNDLFERLLLEDKEFSETIKKGIDLCEAWWIKKGRKGLHDKTFNAVLWYMNMKNRFDWADRADVRHSGDLIVNIKGIDEF